MQPKPGPTGAFPDGKVSADDEGEVLTQIYCTKDGLVRVDFGTELSWFAMPPDATISLALLLIAQAEEARKMRGS